jgi:hypothetical protein
MTKKILEGKLLLYSETGMEGGYLSIQDNHFIKFTSPTFGLSNGSKVWDKNDQNRQGVTLNTEVLINNNWLEFPDPIWKDKDFESSSLYCGEQKGDLEADKRLSGKYNFKIKYAVERLNEIYGQGNWRIDRQLPHVTLKDGTHLHFGDTPETIPPRPYGIPQGAKTRVTVKWNDGLIEYQKISDEILVEQYDYKGLNMLKETDIIKVLDKEKRCVVCEGQINKIPLIVFSETTSGHFEELIKKPDELRDWEKYFTENFNAELHR